MVRPALLRSTIRRLAIAVAAGVVLVLGSMTVETLARYSTLYRRKAVEFRDLESRMIQYANQWQALEQADRDAAAKFRKGEWGRSDDTYRRSFEDLVKTVRESQGGSAVNDLRKRFYESQARSCEASADASHALAVNLGKKATHYSRLRRKYERAARAPWWPLAADPPEPK